MGLSISHDCWNASYGSFDAFRRALALAAGIDMDKVYADHKIKTDVQLAECENGDDAIHILLNHSDCDGYIYSHKCELLVERMEELLPKMPESWQPSVQQFIDGLHHALEDHVGIEFH